jgi:pyruvate dehydrogenase E1 component subunit alpha
MAKAAETTTGADLPDVDTARRLFHMMALIRRFEERTEEQYTRARIGGYCHLAIGEEAATVGAIDALSEGDALFASYRDHGTALAIGSPPVAVMAELFGKETGVAHGRGGSMHLLDAARRFFGGWGIVGGHLPIAVGAALAFDQADQPHGVLCQFGDGATNTGAFHEALNLAAVWNLPIVFQAINNQYGMGTSVAQSSAEPELHKRAVAYRMHGEVVDGNDVLAVREATSRLLDRARAQREPALLETITYRYRGHSVADAGKVYRTQEEITEWRKRDPITRFGLLATEHNLLSADEVEEIWQQVAAEVKEAIDGALEAAFPDTDSLYEHVYGDPAWREQFARMEPGAPYGERPEERVWQT